MRLSLPAFVAIVWSLAASTAHAQSTTDPPLLDLTVSPVRATLFAESEREAGFGSYGLGGAIAVNFTRFVGVEVEIGGAFSGPEPLDRRARPGLEHGTAHLLDYNGNLVFSARSRSSIVPYLTGGVGVLMLFDQEGLADRHAQTHFAGNTGGGVKWLPRNHRWSLRADYRFISVESRDDDTTGFGRHRRYGHRLYGAVVVALRSENEATR